MSQSIATQWMLDRFEQFGPADAILSEKKSWSYTRFLAEIKLIQESFDHSGIRPGDVVILQCADYSHAALASLWALWSIGAIAFPLTTNQSRLLSYSVSIADAKWICKIHDPGDHIEIKPVEFKDPAPDAAINKLNIIRNSAHAGLILLTSGTTALPRLVLHDVARLLERFSRQRRPARTLAFMMFDHMGGIDTVCHTLSSGGALVLPESGERSPASVAALIDRFQIQLLPTSPTFLNHLLFSEMSEKYTLQSLEKISFGTEPMPPATLKKLTEKFPSIRILQSYGTTELGVPGIRTKINDPAWIQFHSDTNEMKIVDGMLFLRSKSAMVGYLNAPDPFDAEGWYPTGDLVEFDETGAFFRVLGRSSDIINVGGEKVSAATVEEVIRQAENIRNVLVSGEKNPLIGQMIVAKIELIEPEKPLDLARRLREHCQNRLARYQIPSRFEVVDQLEQTHSGKLKRIS